MSKTILVACKLPQGMYLDGLSGKHNSVYLNGLNTSLVPGAPGLTNVDEQEWNYLQAAYAEHAAFKNNAIFATGTNSVADAVSMADELKGERTGLEGLDPNNPHPKIKPENEAKLEAALELNQGQAPRRAPRSKADKAAALEAAQAAA